MALSGKCPIPGQLFTLTFGWEVNRSPLIIYGLSLGSSASYPWLAPDIIGGHVSVLKYSEKVFSEFGSIIMQNGSNILPFFHQYVCLIT